MKMLTTASLTSAVCLAAFAPLAPAQSFGSMHPISTTIQDVATIEAADMDGDGDADLLVASGSSAQLAWHENMGAGNFGTVHPVANSSASISSAKPVDFDGDGDIDILATGAFGVALFDNLGAGVFGPEVLVSEPDLFARNAHAVDVDGDGDMDIFAAGGLTGKSSVYDRTWYWRNRGAGNFDVRVDISYLLHQASNVITADLSGNGKPDVIYSAYYYNIAWRENLGNSNFGPAQSLNWGNVTEGPARIVAADFNADNKIDVALVDYHGIYWAENLGGNQFVPLRKISSVGASDLRALDVDSDGLVDIVAATNSGLHWSPSAGDGLFEAAQGVGASFPSTSQLAFADFDGDSDLDVAVASWQNNSAVWFEAEPMADCNGNGIHDALDISAGTSLDCDGNGKPDSCDVQVFQKDIDADGLLDSCQAPALVADGYQLSLLNGATRTFTLNAPGFGQAPYVMLGNIANDTPGFTIQGIYVPLKIDAYMMLCFSSPNTLPFTGFQGTLSPTGQATASFTLPAEFDYSFIGLGLQHAFVTLDLSTGLPNFASNPIPLKLTL